MARKIYVDLSDTINAWREKTNLLGSNVGDLDNLVTTADSDLVAAINEVYNYQPIRDERLRIRKADGTLAKDLYGFATDSSGA
jgi:hypothetical protein